MDEYLFCHNPVTENQVLCLNYGTQIKSLEVSHRFFWRKRHVLLPNQKSYLYESKEMEIKAKIIKRQLKAPVSNLTLDRWL